MNRYFYLLPITAITPFAANAQNNITREATLNPVVITGTGTYHKAENSPVEVKVISAKQLKDANVGSLQEALTKLTTNITTQTNGMGTSVNYNGVSDDYLLILENGKRVTGDDRWNRISIDNIKRIEILSGAASALYGSDAIAGVINIITDNNRNGLNAISSTRVMDKGRFDQDVNVDVTEGKFSSHTSFNHRQADNWQVNKYQAFDEDGKQVLKLTGRPMSQAFTSNNISEKLEWRFSDKLDVYMKGNLYGHETGRDRGATYYTQKATKDKETGEKTYTYTSKQAYTYDIKHKTFNIGAGARWVPNNNTHIYLDVFTDNFKSIYDYWQTAKAEAHEETRKNTIYYNETLKGIFRLNDWNKVSGGIEFEQAALKSASDNIEKETTNTYNVFVQDEVNILKGLEAVVGFRYTHNDNFGNNITPNAALFYHIGGFRVRASYAEGYRTPTLSQLYATDQAKLNSRYTINNPSLKAEKNRFWNANMEYSNNWMSVSVSGFYNKIRNMINYRTMTKEEIEASAELTAIQNDGWTTIRQRDNIDKASIKGISANLKLLLPYGFTIAGGYTFSDTEAETKTLNAKTQEYSVKKTPVDKSVKNVANVMAAWDHSWKNYHLNVHINGHMQSKRYSSTYGYAPEYQQWDIMTKHIFSLKQVTVEPGIGVDNVFNKRDTSYWNSNFSTVNPGRSLMLSLTLKFKD